MVRTSIRATLLIAALMATLTGCSSGSQPGVATAVSPSTSAPSRTWLAVLSSSADPNDLDASRADVVAALGVDDGSVVVSPGACFTGIPQRYGPLYVLALSDATRTLVEDRLQQVGTDPEWIGAVTPTCLD